MNLRRAAATPPSRGVVDAVIDAYVAWREESTAVSVAYAHWGAAGPDDRDTAFSAYAAALDREEHAADRYRWSIERVACGCTGTARAVAPSDRNA